MGFTIKSGIADRTYNLPDQNGSIALSENDQLWVNGIKKASVIEYSATSNVTNGLAIFYLTTDGTPTGDPIFTSVWLSTLKFLTPETNNLFNYGNVVVSEDLRSLTVSVNKIALSLGVLVFNTAVNGTSVYLNVKGQ